VAMMKAGVYRPPLYDLVSHFLSFRLVCSGLGYTPRTLVPVGVRGDFLYETSRRCSPAASTATIRRGMRKTAA